MQFFVVLNSGWEANTYIYECAATVLVNHWSIVICDSHKMPSPFGHQFLTTANDREKKRSEHKQDNKTEFEWSYMFTVKWHKVFIHVRILFVRCFCSVVFSLLFCDAFDFCSISFLFVPCTVGVFFSSSAFATIYISWMFLALMLMPFVSISIMDGWFCFNKNKKNDHEGEERKKGEKLSKYVRVEFSALLPNFLPQYIFNTPANWTKNHCVLHWQCVYSLLFGCISPDTVNIQIEFEQNTSRDLRSMITMILCEQDEFYDSLNAIYCFSITFFFLSSFPPKTIQIFVHVAFCLFWFWCVYFCQYYGTLDLSRSHSTENPEIELNLCCGIGGYFTYKPDFMLYIHFVKRFADTLVYAGRWTVHSKTNSFNQERNTHLYSILSDNVVHVARVQCHR